MNQITKGSIASLSCPKYLANASGLTLTPNSPIA